MTTETQQKINYAEVAARAKCFGESATAIQAACRYVRRKLRLEDPEGSFDKAGRWYPDVSERLDTSKYRSPSRAWPYSYMLPCRILAHCAMLHGCNDLSPVRTFAKLIERSETTESALKAISDHLTMLSQKKIRVGKKKKAEKKKLEMEAA